MDERAGAATLQGKPLTLIGKELRVGDAMPDCDLVDANGLPVKLSAFKGKPLIISSVLSLDTPVCDMQTRRFNDEATKLNKNLNIVSISMDLPPALKRWCGASGCSQIKTLSDHKDASFGRAFGTLIKEIRLLARIVLVVDSKGTIRYVEYVKEATQHPNYEKALQEVEKLISEKPQMASKGAS